jgi:hypothetical protein
MIAGVGGAQDPASPAPAEVVRREIVRRQADLARKFQDFKASLLRRAQRLERRPELEDHARAALLKKALQACRDEELDRRFDSVIAALQTPKAISLAEIHEILAKSRPVPEKLQVMLTTLAADPRSVPAFLKVRCTYLLRTHVEIHSGMVQLGQAIAANPDNKPRQADVQRAVRLSDRAREIDREAGQLVGLLKANAPDSQYLDVLLQKLGGDARQLQRRLAKADVGTDSQSLAERIGTKLQETLTAIRKEMPYHFATERRSKEEQQLQLQWELAALKLDKEITRLGDAHLNVLEVIRALEAKKLNEADLPSWARKVGEAEKATGAAREGAQEVQADCAAILKALKEQKALSSVTAQLEERVARPLSQALKEDFPAACKALAPLRVALEAGRLDAGKANGVGERFVRLRNRLGDVQDGLQDLPGTNELIARLADIELEQRKILERLEGLKTQLEEDLLDGLLK